MFAAMVWGEETKQPGFVEKLTLWMRQVFPSSMWYPNKFSYPRKCCWLWAHLLLWYKQPDPEAWKGIQDNSTDLVWVFIWDLVRISQAVMQEMKTPSSGGKVVAGERGRRGRLWVCLCWCRAGNLLTPCSRKQHSRAAGASSLSWNPVSLHDSWAPDLLKAYSFFFQCRVSWCLPAAYAVGPKKWMCKYFVSHSSPRSSFWNSKQAQNPKKISLSYE